MNTVKRISICFLCIFLWGCSFDHNENLKNIAQFIIDQKYEELKNLNYAENVKNQLDEGLFTVKETMKLMGDYQETLSIHNNQILLEYEKANIQIDVSFNENDEISGISLFPQRKEEVKLPSNIEERKLVLKNGKYELSGTLTLPQGNEKYPVIILVHGSGANDQDETLIENKPFRDLAYLLAKQGIATYRYDKRTKVYASDFVSDKDFDIYDETIDDVKCAVDLLKAQENIDDSQIYILGHSLGGYVMPLIAEVTPDTKGYIMMSAPVSSLLDLMPQQIEFLSQLDGKMTDQEKLQIQTINSQIQMIKDNKTNGQLVLGAYQKYWDLFLDYNPIEKAKKIKKPVMVLQGEEDYQVPIEEYQKWKKEFGKQWTFHQYSNLTHLMMNGYKTSGQFSYLVPETVDQRVIDDIVKFINRNK